MAVTLIIAEYYLIFHKIAYPDAVRIVPTDGKMALRAGKTEGETLVQRTGTVVGVAQIISIVGV